MTANTPNDSSLQTSAASATDEALLVGLDAIAACLPDKPDTNAMRHIIRTKPDFPAFPYRRTYASTRGAIIRWWNRRADAGRAA